MHAVVRSPLSSKKSKQVGFHPSFSRQAKVSKLSLVFWLNENVHILLALILHSE